MEQYDLLDKLSYDDAMEIAKRMIGDHLKFDTELSRESTISGESSSQVVVDFFSLYESVVVRFGDLRMYRSAVSEMNVNGRMFTRVGFDVDGLHVLLDKDGRVWEWDEEVLDGPCAPSMWHYVVWVSHLIYDIPLESLNS